MRRLPSLQFLTLDGTAQGHVSQAREACAGGVRWVQLRAKGLVLDEWVDLAREVVATCRAHGALCTINDSPEVALAAGADGVHLGRADASPAAARILLGPAALIGVTLNHRSDLARLGDGRPDYVGVGPFRATPTKSGHAPVHTTESLAALIAAAGLPAYAIGGVNAADFPELYRLGAAGAAVSAAIATAPDITGAAARLVSAAEACWPPS